MERDAQFYKMAAKSDLMRVAQSAGRLNVPQAYETWMMFLSKALENMEKAGTQANTVDQLKTLIQPKEKILYDLKSRLRWAEKVLDVACML